MKVLLLLLSAILPSVTAIGFNINQANTSLWLSAAAYCGKQNYPILAFKQGPTAGFIYTATISNELTDTEGFIGYLPSKRMIYVVFRGSSSIENWLTDLDVVKVPYISYPQCHCEVHLGFYTAEQTVIVSIIAEVWRLKLRFPRYAVQVTGHSLGGALAQLSAMDMKRAGITSTVYSFGQPRVGDKEYAAFAGTKVQTWRITHDRDGIPHLPPRRFGFWHVCQEVFEQANGKLRFCDSSCEDPSCADQYDLEETNLEDHFTYLALHVTCNAVSIE